jgi:hypothetical protein
MKIEDYSIFFNQNFWRVGVRRMPVTRTWLWCCGAAFAVLSALFLWWFHGAPSRPTEAPSSLYPPIRHTAAAEINTTPPPSVKPEAVPPSPISLEPFPLPKLGSAKSKTLAETCRDLESASENKDAVTLVAELGVSSLSEGFMPSLRKILIQGYTGVLIGEIGYDPRVRRILDEGNRLRDEDPAAFGELILLLQDQMANYGTGRIINGNPFLDNANGAHAWPYLLAKLDPSPENLRIILAAGERVKTLIEQQFQDNLQATGDFALFDSGRLVVNYDTASRTFLGYAAYLCLNTLIGDEDYRAALTEQGRAVLEEYLVYEAEFESHFGEMGEQMEVVSPGTQSAIQGIDLDSRESLAAQMSLYGRVIPSRYADRNDGLYQRPDFILEFASEIISEAKF